MEKNGAKIWNVPNALTMLRMLLLPVYWVLFTQGERYIALAVFIIASLTDLLDGYIARKHQLVTSFGKLMDPLADKLMVLSVMLSLALAGFLPWVPLMILLCKEVLMVVGGGVMLMKGIVVASKPIGKAAQATVVASLILSFFAPEFESLGFPVHLVLIWCAVALTLCAIVHYGKNALRMLGEAKEK